MEELCGCLDGGTFWHLFFQHGLFYHNVVIFTNLFSSMSGLVLARTSIPGRRLLPVLFLLTLFLPRGYTILPTFDLILKLHLNNTLWAVILVNTATGLVFNTFLYMGYFRTIHKEIEEAAVVDGVKFPPIVLEYYVAPGSPDGRHRYFANFPGQLERLFYPAGLYARQARITDASGGDVRFCGREYP